MPDGPAISIVVPSHNREDLLRQLFDALERQVPEAPRFDVVVVADGCRDGTVALCASYPGGFRVHVVETPGCGPAVARNRGVEIATAPLLLFLDDDVIPEPGLIRAHALAHRDRPGSAVVGPYPPWPHASEDLFRLRIRDNWLKHFDAVGARGHRFGYRDLLTGNLSLDRDLWTAMGGLDPAFAYAREDLEFGVRLIERGVDIRFCPDAFAWHHEHLTSSLSRAFRRARDEGRSDALLALKHPNLRPILAVSRTAMVRRGRVARTLLLGRRGAGAEALCRLGVPVLRLLDRLGLRKSYTRLFNRLHSLAYHRGAGEVLDGHWWKIFPAEAGDQDDYPRFDLRDGIERIERELDRLRPRGAVITDGGIRIAVLRDLPGHEPLAGRHLRPALLQAARPDQLLAALERSSEGAPAAPPQAPAPDRFHLRGYDGFMWENAAQWARAKGAAH